MPRPKRKRVSVRLSVSMDAAVHAKLLRLADRQDASLAWMIRKALAEFIEQQEEDNQAYSSKGILLLYHCLAR